MGSAGDVVEISSDDEDFLPLTKKLPIDPDGWIAGLLQEDERVILDGYDDLMVMSKLSTPPVSQKKGKPDGGGGDEDDDDCVVLDSDPDKAVTVAEENGSAGDGSSDELQIVAEKGPVACRDFPHSRHLCSNLPFGTTSHVKHCSMCHCFVCDAPAPCTYWGKGNSINDHCHATDKETKWKTLRQIFKCKSLPTSHPEKHQNVVYPAMTLPGQQDTQYQIPECEISFIRSYTSFHSLDNQSHLLNVVNQSQNQQRHTSVRVSPNVGRTVSAPRASPATRAGRSTSNAPAVPITQSSTRFKRAGATSPDLATLNDNLFGPASPNNALVHQASRHVSQPVQVAPRTNSLTGTFQNKPSQRSLSAPIAFQGQQSQSASSYQAASNGMHGTGQQFSRCTSLTTQRTQLLPEPVMDVCSKSWEDILASVASDLGVPDYNAGTGMSQQPVITFPQSLHSNAYQGVGLHSESVAATANLMSCNGHNLSNGTTGGNVQANGPAQTTQAVRLLNRQSSLIPNGAHLNNSVSAPADALLIEAANQRDMPGLDSTDILFDFELEGWG